MKLITASPHPSHAAAATGENGLGIALYHSGSEKLAGLGNGLPEAVRKLPRSPSVRAWDFLSLALAVYGTDRFVSRYSTPDGWTRQIALNIEVAEPEPWMAVSEKIAATLRFLTGDIWQIRFSPGGARPPEFDSAFSDRDCACLFSGGLDSLIGAADLVANGRRPLLVSQASPKEGPAQKYLAGQIGLEAHRFEGKVIEKFTPPYEPSSRARSILFIAYGVLAAEALPGQSGSLAELIVPENGLISINPPLTRRRVGSFSTRTTHPHFVHSLQDVLHEVGLAVQLVNPYRFKTKGEMLAECRNAGVKNLAKSSYSCGKGKRLNQHCGRCVPCLIRRASFQHAGWSDATPYWASDLAVHGTNDDVFAARTAMVQLQARNMAQWTAETGPLPVDSEERMKYVDVVRRGLGELKTFLDSVRWP